MGDTGVAWKQPLYSGSEVLVRCGSQLTYTEPARPDRSALPIQGRWLQLDATWHQALWGLVGLECQGSAAPALNPGERDRISQDLRVVLPLGAGGQFQFGVQHYWEASGDTKPGSDGAQLSGGLRLKW
jgi:hypothetical protein